MWCVSFSRSWLAGNWKVRSTTKDVQAPCGIALFGGNTTFNNARYDIGSVLNYESRFVSDSMGRGIIADRRAFRVASVVSPSSIGVSHRSPDRAACRPALSVPAHTHPNALRMPHPGRRRDGSDTTHSRLNATA